MHIAYDVVAGVIAGTRDWFPGHHDPSYARAQGKKDIYLNTGFFQGFIDRAALEHCGERSWVVRRELRMDDSVYPGDTLTAVVTEQMADQAEGWVDLVVDLVTDGESRPAVVGKVRVQVAVPESEAAGDE
jgi:acyl dehydratase